MPARSYSLHVALVELGFAITTFAVGLWNGPAVAAGLVCIAMLAYWSHARAAILNRLPIGTWARITGGAYIVIIAIEAGAYWIGLGVGARMS